MGAIHLRKFRSHGGVGGEFWGPRKGSGKSDFGKVQRPTWSVGESW